MDDTGDVAHAGDDVDACVGIEHVSLQSFKRGLKKG